MRTYRIIPILAATALLLAVGCSQQTVNSADKDANHDITVADQKVDQAAKDVKPEITKLDNEAKPKLTALDLGARVTTAIQANQNLPHDSIRVDANPNGVRLRGTVKTAAQKHLAAQVAKDTLGPGKTVVNNLAVSG